MSRKSPPRPAELLRRHRRPAPTMVAVAAVAGLAAAAYAGIGAILVAGSWPAWRELGASLVTGADWAYREGVFGAAAMLFGTAAVAALAVAIAGPLALGTAIFAAEWAGRPLRLAIKSTVELLAGVPSVVWGLLGILVLRDHLFRWLAPLEPLSGDMLFTAGVLLAGMILPTVATLAEDAIVAVPGRQREAARALGLTRAETVARVVLPQALPGLCAALLLGLGRALGETIAVYLVVGRLDGQLPRAVGDWRLLADAGQTLTSKLAGPELFLSWDDPLHRAALLALGVLLLAITSIVTLAGLALAERGRRRA